MKEPTNIFSTPLWLLRGKLPNGIHEWVKEYQRENPSMQVSNRGGYQSKAKGALDDMPFEYSDYIREKLLFLPEFRFCNWWLNVNYKGDYNVLHTHPVSDLAVVWYLTDNHNLLNLRDPSAHPRWSLYERMGISPDYSINAYAGDMIIFPSDLQHEVEPNQSDTPRVCISLNLSFT